ncbi:hypothetical protein GOARA_035_00170 [Gordonia araii NBRC 100433]|uniref:Bacterial bifunctional deaminase-reductase C-terminal domain-containing protein n=1 Tax=Gordonia araii NBRC 100433 TaxID=1073574 RepID=G7H086_9ACTN|nr:hypothetical protein GOARA_035_00170 [Gordonia araii NBRC 100433]
MSSGEVEYVDTGGTGDAVVLLHGALMDEALWLPVVERLAPRWRCIVPVLPLRSHGSLALNRALMAAGLVDRLQVTIFPVISGRTGDAPIFAGADDFDLELIEQHTLDGRIQELVYRPALHG